MSEQALAWLAQIPAEELSHAEYRILNRLCWLHDAEKGYAWPSYNYLAKVTAVSKGGITKCMAKMEEKGFLSRDKGPENSTAYRLNLGSVHSVNPPARVHSVNERVHSVNYEGSLSSTKVEQLNITEVELSPHIPTEVEVAFSEYNDAATLTGWPKAQALTKQRKARIASRLKDAGGIEGWRTALEKAAASDFLSGRKTDFMVSLDFILQASSFTKLMEGNYDNRTSNSSGLRPSDDPTLRAIFDAATDVAARGVDRN